MVWFWLQCSTVSFTIRSLKEFLPSQRVHVSVADVCSYAHFWLTSKTKICLLTSMKKSTWKKTKFITMFILLAFKSQHHLTSYCSAQQKIIVNINLCSSPAQEWARLWARVLRWKNFVKTCDQKINFNCRQMSLINKSINE